MKTKMIDICLLSANEFFEGKKCKSGSVCTCVLTLQGSGLENQLTSKLCCFQLLELMYGRLTKEEVFGKSSVINKKFCEVKSVNVDTGKEMTQVIMR